MAELYNYINEQGIINPDTQDVLATVQQEWTDAFGSSLSLEGGTPQGRIIEFLTAERKATVSNMAFIANQLNPNYATGTFLDSIGGFFGVQRRAQTYTTVLYVQLGGVAGTPIPAGSQAQDTSGNTYALSEQVTLGSNGQGYGTFVNLVAGAIPCPPNTLNIIATPVSGWESVNNGNFGTLGSDTESDADYRLRIQNSKSIYSTSMLDSLKSALYEINGLKSYSYYENYTNQVQTNADNAVIPVGESVAPHSIFLFAWGGTNDSTFYSQIAQAMLNKRSGGCGMQASVVYPTNVRQIDVIDNGSAYKMTFNTPEAVPIYITMQVRNVSYTGSDLTSAVKDVILNWFAGNLSNVQPFGIGVDISPFDLSYVVSSQLGVVVLSCFIGTSPNPTSTDIITIPMNQIAVCIATETNPAVSIG